MTEAFRRQIVGCKTQQRSLWHGLGSSAGVAPALALNRFAKRNTLRKRGIYDMSLALLPAPGKPPAELWLCPIGVGLGSSVEHLSGSIGSRSHAITDKAELTTATAGWQPELKPKGPLTALRTIASPFPHAPRGLPRVAINIIERSLQNALLLFGSATLGCANKASSHRCQRLSICL